ncbi:MAG: hypothetical protein RL569_726 [Actinomycetota bacterium]
MSNPWLSYSILRLGLFALIFWGFLSFDFNPFFAAVIAAAISFALSLVFLDKQRKAMSEQVSRKLARDKSGSYADPESDLENQILDSEPEANRKKPEADQ